MTNQNNQPFRDRFSLNEIDPHNPIHYSLWEVFEYLKHPSFSPLDTSRWARAKFCLVHRYGLFYERPKKPGEISKLLGYKNPSQVYAAMEAGLKMFRKNLIKGKKPFDESFCARVGNNGLLYAIQPFLLDKLRESKNK